MTPSTRGAGALGLIALAAVVAIVGACTAFSSTPEPGPEAAGDASSAVPEGGAAVDSGSLPGVRCGTGRCASSEVCCGKQGEVQRCTSRGDCVGTYSFECESAAGCAGRIADRSPKCCGLLSGGALYAGTSCAPRCVFGEVCDLNATAPCPSGQRCVEATWPPGYGYCGE